MHRATGPLEATGRRGRYGRWWCSTGSKAEGTLGPRATVSAHLHDRAGYAGFDFFYRRSAIWEFFKKAPREGS